MPVTELWLRRMADAARLGVTPKSGEPVWTTDTKLLYVGDGSTVGGIVIGGRFPRTSVSTTYTIVENDGVVLCDAASGSFTVTLPPASGIDGKVYHIKKTDSSANVVTIDGDGSETIDGALTQVLASQYDALTITSDDTEWWII